MQPERYDVSVYLQESLNLALTCYTDNDATSLLDLTGYSVAFRIMDKPAGTVLATLTGGSGVTLGGAAGTIVVTRTSAQLAALGIDTGAYDLVVTSTGGVATLLLHGSFTVVKT